MGRAWACGAREILGDGVTTLVETLSDAIDRLDVGERGFYFASRTTSVTQLSFLKLRQVVRSLARKLSHLGCQPGDPVIIAIADQAQFIQVFLSVIRAGLVAVPVYPPSVIADLNGYIADIERIRRVTGAKHVLTCDALYQRMHSNGTVAGLTSWSDIAFRRECGELPCVSGSDAALIQFTSGSTGSPKGVELSHGNLISNSLAIQHSLAINPASDRGVSWLPFHHDMGLIGFLITPVLVQASTWLLSPLEFVRRPQRWLELIHETKATISYAPNFAYELAARSLKTSKCKHWDLSCWRVAGCGGEPIVSEVLNRFAQQLEPAGFDAAAFVPSYGLAEATVAVTIARSQSGLVQRTTASNEDRDTRAISAGYPVCDTEVRIASGEGTVLADGLEGEIQVRGPGVARCYWTETGCKSLVNSDGFLSTGDLGVLIQGELYVSGRIKESIVVNGCNYYPQDIEQCVQTIDGVRHGNVVVFGRPEAASEQLVLVTEATHDSMQKTLRRKLRETVRQKLGLSIADVVFVSRGTIRRTTSGKLKRSALKQRYLAGEFKSCSPHELADTL